MLRLLLGCTLVFAPTVCLALGEFTAGNKPLSPGNYAEWPGLIDAVNDKSRIYQTWVNGNETLYYRGNTETANRTLKKFGQTRLPKLHLVILPASDQVETIDKKPVAVDYKIGALGGIVKGWVERFGLEAVHPLHPTMTIYLTDRIQLEDLQIPENVELFHLTEIENRLQSALESEDSLIKEQAESAIESLNKEYRRQGAEYKDLQATMARIEKFIEAQRKKNTKADS